MQQIHGIESNAGATAPGRSILPARKISVASRGFSSAVLIGATIALLSAPAYAQTNGTWTQKAPLPGARAEVGVAEVDGKVYVVGGSDEKAVTVNTNEMYDPATDKWQARAPLPKALQHVGVTSMGGKIYAVGGFTGDVHMNPQPTLFAYDPKANSWSELANFSGGRGSVAVAAVDGKLHIFGGRDSRKVVELSFPNGLKFTVGQGTVRTHEIYDPATNKWSIGTEIPEPQRDHMGIAVLNGKVHLFGGRIEGSADLLDKHDIYDPKTDTWTSAAPLPRKRSSGAFTVLDGLIIYAGGECKPGGMPQTLNSFEDVSAYDTKTGTWSALTTMTSPRNAFGGATVGKVAYFAAGAPTCGGGHSADLFAFTLP